MLRFDVLTLFPRMFDSFLSESILKRAIAAKRIRVDVHDIRSEATDKHRTCDDRPFGGGPGMVLKPEPIDRLCRRLWPKQPARGTVFINLSPRGRPFDQAAAVLLAKKKRIFVLCGHYEGVDQRAVDAWADLEFSVGDYVLTGGEPAAMVILDAVSRLVPGVLGNRESKMRESFDRHLLEYPQYTRPAVFRGRAVPRVLLSGNHPAIETWRREESLRITRTRRPDLFARADLGENRK